MNKPDTRLYGAIVNTLRQVTPYDYRLVRDALAECIATHTLQEAIKIRLSKGLGVPNQETDQAATVSFTTKTLKYPSLYQQPMEDYCKKDVESTLRGTRVDLRLADELDLVDSYAGLSVVHDEVIWNFPRPGDYGILEERVAKHLRDNVLKVNPHLRQAAREFIHQELREAEMRALTSLFTTKARQQGIGLLPTEAPTLRTCKVLNAFPGARFGEMPRTGRVDILLEQPGGALVIHTGVKADWFPCEGVKVAAWRPCAQANPKAQGRFTLSVKGQEVPPWIKKGTVIEVTYSDGQKSRFQNPPLRRLSEEEVAAARKGEVHRVSWVEV